MKFILDYDNLNSQEVLESKIRELNEAHRQGNTLVDDSVYDDLIVKLSEMFPDSPLLKELWSGEDEVEDDLDVYLGAYPLKSILTIKSFNDKPVFDFSKRVEAIQGGGKSFNVCLSAKLNGHAVRVVFKKGKLIKARSRGRVNTKDLTKQLKVILGDQEGLKDFDLVELRGEVVLPLGDLNKARELNPDVKNAFTAVSSLIKESDSSGYTLLHFVCYDVLGDGFKHMNLSSKFSKLAEIGLEVPKHLVRTIDSTSMATQVENFVAEMDLFLIDYKYFTDGVVMAIDDWNLFTSVGEQDKFRNGNLALKVGRWKQDNYSGIVKEIEFTRGKGKRTPVAIIEPTLTVGGNTVTRVPLFTPLNILLLEAFPGNILFFKYGGESGVLPALPDGTTILV